jgi:hypothetical protein
VIDVARFVETSDNFDAWLAARRPAVTATEVAEAATPSGFALAVAERRNPSVVTANAYMKFGSEHEAWIARDLMRRFGVMPNKWLIAAADSPLHMATPDGLSLDHTRMAEIKTGGTEKSSIPIRHMRQMAWQFHCNEFAEEIVYAFMLRQEINGVYVPAWIEPKTQVIKRSDVTEIISELVVVANRLLKSDMEMAA